MISEAHRENVERQKETFRRILVVSARGRTPKCRCGKRHSRGLKGKLECPFYVPTLNDYDALQARKGRP